MINLGLKGGWIFQQRFISSSDTIIRPKIHIHSLQTRIAPPARCLVRQEERTWSENKQNISRFAQINLGCICSRFKPERTCCTWQTTRVPWVAWNTWLQYQYLKAADGSSSLVPIHVCNVSIPYQNHGRNFGWNYQWFWSCLKASCWRVENHKSWFMAERETNHVKRHWRNGKIHFWRETETDIERKEQKNWTDAKDTEKLKEDEPRQSDPQTQ